MCCAACATCYFCVLTENSARETMSERLLNDWLQGRASLAAASEWTTEEMRLVADLGYALAEQGRDHEALTIFEGLTALAPATAYFQAALGALRLRLGEPRLALGHLDAALAADQQNISAFVNRGEAYLQLGEYGAAARDLEAALRLGETLQAEDESLRLARARALLLRLRTLAGDAADA
jgi:tetratricopeptide (TPR) repeat protein